MASGQSPGVYVREFEVGGIVVGVATSVGALAGVFRWGPIGERLLIDSEDTMVSMVGSPTNFNAETWFSGSSFLAYTNGNGSGALQLVRAANTTGSSPIVSVSLTSGNATATVSNTSTLTAGMILAESSNSSAIAPGAVISSIVNSTAFSFTSASVVVGTDAAASLQFVSNTSVFNAIVNTASVANLQAQIVRTEDHFVEKYADAEFDTDVPYVARWAGDLGNSLKISVCESANQFSSNVDLTSSGVYTANVVANVSSNVAVLSIGANTSNDTFNVNTYNTFLSSTVNGLTVGDRITTGNTDIGEQTIKIVSIGSYANVGPAANSVATVNAQATSANLVTTGGAFSGITNGDWLAVFSNSSTYRTVRVSTVTDTNNLVLTANVGFTNGTSNWASLNAVTRSVSITLEDQYRRSTDWSSGTLRRSWEYSDAFDVAPGQSEHVLENGNTSANDELHIVVVDEDGKFTGDAGSILEKYSGVSRATDAKGPDGSTIYYRDVINDASRFIWAVNDRTGAVSNTALNVASSSNTKPFTASFQYGFNGSDESTVAIGTLTNAWDLFESSEDVDISLIITGKNRGGTHGGQLANYLVDNIAEPRMDAVVFASPEKADVVNNAGFEATDIVDWRNSLRSSSYLFLDGNWKYMYDRYNDVYRWIPLCGDIAGLAAQTEQTNDAWWSFAGFNRGHIKNVVKLAWNPRKPARDLIWKSSVNPVVTFPGDGTILYGDKVALAKPSIFDRINVRRLFIHVEKAIAKRARYTLFEFNDPITRAAFRNMIIPFLRDIQGRRGITRFEVQCDGNNNTAQVINEKRFVCDIAITPAQAINTIELNFYGVPEGVAFTEVIRTS